MGRRRVRRRERLRVDREPSSLRTAARRQPSLRRRQDRGRAERKRSRHRTDDFAHRPQNSPLRLRISPCSPSEATTRSSHPLSLLRPLRPPLLRPPTTRSLLSLSFPPRPLPCSRTPPRRTSPISRSTLEGPSRRRPRLEEMLHFPSRSTWGTGQELRRILSGMVWMIGVS